MKPGMERKLLFVVGSDWASAYYRITQPAHKLQELGYDVDIINFRDLDVTHLVAWVPILFQGCPNKYNILSTQKQEDDSLTSNVHKSRKVDLTKYHTVVFQLVWNKDVLGVMKKLKYKGIRVVMELDDDYFTLPPHNNAFYQFHPKYKLVSVDGKTMARKHNKKVNNSLDVLKEACKVADLLQVSTPQLAERYSILNDNIAVLLNSVDNSLYDDVNQDKLNDKPTICWYGTRTHIEDLRQVVGCIPQDTNIYLAGSKDFREKLFHDYPNVKSIGGFDLKEDLPRIIKSCDIGIVPLEDRSFNQGKSELKGIEFGAGGLPIIVSDVAPYRRYVEHGVNGLIVKKNKTKFWIRYIKQLLEDKDLRIKLGKANKKSAMDRDISKYIKEWERVYFK